MESGEGFEPSTSGFLADRLRMRCTGYKTAALPTAPPRHSSSICLGVYHKRVAHARLFARAVV